MSTTEDRERRGTFDEDLRTWASRPLPTDPARAARKVLAAIPAGKAPRPLLQLVAVATVLVAIILGALLGTPGRQTQPTRTAQADAPARLDERVVQFWIDPQTPVYFVLRPLGSAQGGNS